jgi:predicted 3-demethylubiquinone-9 3-methyltransferase (glyoxalase superfamily)
LSKLSISAAVNRPLADTELEGVSIVQKITPFLWFNDNAEEAVNCYCSIFKDSKVEATTRYTDAGPGPKGSVMTIAFELNGQKFVAINGGPIFKFTEAVSFVVNCADQAEVDYYWEKLTAGGKEVQCGWLKDKYGLSWQIVPTALPQVLKQADPKKSQAVMQAMFKMKKLDVAKLQEAANGA